MKFIYIYLICSTVVLGLLSQSYAENTETYNLVVPQELSGIADNGFITMSGIGTHSGVVIGRTHDQSHSGTFVCLAPMKNGVVATTRLVATFPGRNPIWYKNIFFTYNDSQKDNYPWNSMFFAKINNQDQLGQIFSYRASPGFGAPSACSFSENLIPEATTKTLTYNIRIQFPENTKLEFNKRVHGKKTWILKRQNNDQDTYIMYSSFLDYGLNSEWKITTAITKKLDGTTTDIIKQYREPEAGSEGFVVSKDTELLSITFTRK